MAFRYSYPFVARTTTGTSSAVALARRTVNGEPIGFHAVVHASLVGVSATVDVECSTDGGSTYRAYHTLTLDGNDEEIQQLRNASVTHVRLNCTALDGSLTCIVINEDAKGEGAKWASSNWSPYVQGSMPAGSIYVPVASTGQVAGNINDALSAGKVVILGDDEYEVSESIMLAQTGGLVGQGSRRTTIKAGDASNTDAIVDTTNFAALVAADENEAASGMPYGYVLQGFAVNGNNGNTYNSSPSSTTIGSNQSSGTGVGVRTYGANHRINNILIYDTLGDGLYTRNASSNTADRADVRNIPENVFDKIRIWKCGGHGWYYQCLDSEIGIAVIGSNLGAWCFKAADGNARIGQMHVYGTQGGMEISGGGWQIGKLYVDTVSPGVVVLADRTTIDTIYGLNVGDSDHTTAYSRTTGEFNTYELLHVRAADHVHIGRISGNWGDANEGYRAITIMPSADDVHIGTVNLGMHTGATTKTGTAIMCAGTRVSIGHAEITGFDRGLELLGTGQYSIRGRSYSSATHIVFGERYDASVLESSRLEWDAYTESGETAVGGPSARPRARTDVSIRAHGDSTGQSHSSGTATISNGTSSVAVTHGLLATPYGHRIRVTGGSSGLGALYIDTITSTQFTIHNAPGNVTGDQTVYWNADIEAGDADDTNPTFASGETIFADNFGDQGAAVDEQMHLRSPTTNNIGGLYVVARDSASSTSHVRGAIVKRASSDRMERTSLAGSITDFVFMRVYTNDIDMTLDFYNGNVAGTPSFHFGLCDGTGSVTTAGSVDSIDCSVALNSGGYYARWRTAGTATETLEAGSPHASLTAQYANVARVRFTYNSSTRAVLLTAQVSTDGEIGSTFGGVLTLVNTTFSGSPPAMDYVFYGLYLPGTETGCWVKNVTVKAL